MRELDRGGESIVWWGMVARGGGGDMATSATEGGGFGGFWEVGIYEFFRMREK